MGKRRSLTKNDKQNIIILFQEGIKQKDIAAKLNYNQSTVSRAIYQYKKYGISLDHKHPSGRPRKTSAREERIIQRTIRKNRFTTLLDTKVQLEKRGINISVSTTFRRLKDLGYINATPKRKPLLTQKQRKKRIDWAKIKVKNDSTFWNRVIFSDESSFEIPIGDHGKVWRKKESNIILSASKLVLNILSSL